MSPSPTRKRHDREEVLVAAEGIVDREGWTHLTMTALANELGVKVPSLYNHVPNLEALRGELQNRAFVAIGAQLSRAAMGRSGPPALRALAAAFRRFALEHPGRYDLAMREPVDRERFEAASIEAGRALWAVIGSYGITQDAIELQLSAFAALHGVLVLENAGFFPPGVDTDAIYEQVLGLVLGLLEAATPDERRAG
jgi:AcrR family transcriptional regulator